MCFIILNATSILLFILFPCKSVTKKKNNNNSLLCKTNYSRKQVLCFSAIRVRRDLNKFKYSGKLKD